MKVKGNTDYIRYRSSERITGSESFLKGLNIEGAQSGTKKIGNQLEYLKKLIISNSEESVEKRNLLGSERRNTEVRVDEPKPLNLSSIQENDSALANQQEGVGMEIQGMKKQKHVSLFKPSC